MDTRDRSLDSGARPRQLPVSPAPPSLGARLWNVMETIFFGETLAETSDRHWREFEEECQRKDIEWQERMSRC
jgi:hypothetical protein